MILMKEQFNSERFSFLPMVKHSRGHKNWGANEGQPLRECGSKMLGGREKSEQA